MLKNSPGLSTSKDPELHFEADHFKSQKSILRQITKSGTPFRGGPLQRNISNVLLFFFSLGLEETNLGISKTQNSNSKWTEIFRRSAVGFLKEISKTRKLGVLLILISKVRGWIPKRNFEDPEPHLRQTSYLKAHGFPDANKRWGRIKVRGSQLFRCLLMEFQSWIKEVKVVC
ncbi:hypothetical protein RclHR1_19100003 [Rhizophagus clarus]|uniref:Uncharacterized protein n=1 Tax=Rhizophagus clarus TaxID=94130 RepID=A0A2Z6QT54_9GLOM|nr:hypothetical protein RclHR1_19100003 [Rhizophagus clarus]